MIYIVSKIKVFRVLIIIKNMIDGKVTSGTNYYLIKSDRILYLRFVSQKRVSN